MSTPGASLAYAGNLRLWQHAADMLDSIDIPPNLDLTQQDNEVPNSWTSFLRFDHSPNWFTTLVVMMGKYCKFWRGSCPLSDCSPEGSAAGAVRLYAIRGSSIFKCAEWSPAQGEYNIHEHGNTNQFGHYILQHDATLSFNAANAFEDLPDLHAQADLTFHYNMLYKERNAKKLRKGPFWTIHPDTHTLRNISVYQAIPATLVRESRDYPC
ncbi:uncharacterized protein LOC110723747 [Chenopodium quinoa]|uniref:uncharacterized protein LOC110723747 n=1 Tax=Chenopodium quinoa TaxID=63459 RepID=UPI000B777049|nr:uncharacterized protein LOC110723747 [Chenopodium quinoa]